MRALLGHKCFGRPPQFLSLRMISTCGLGKDMPTKKFDGTIEGKPVKVIVVDKGYTKMWFAKPKMFDVNTPHFEQRVNGTLEVHLDSADGKSFSVMKVDSICSGSFYSGSTFAENRGMDIALLPMSEEATGFAIDVRAGGSYLDVPSGSVWCLMALGSFGPWQRKEQ